MILAASGHQFLAALCGLGILFCTMLGPKLIAYVSAWLEVHRPRTR